MSISDCEEHGCNGPSYERHIKELERELAEEREAKVQWKEEWRLAVAAKNAHLPESATPAAVVVVDAAGNSSVVLDSKFRAALTPGEHVLFARGTEVATPVARIVFDCSYENGKLVSKRNPQIFCESVDLMQYEPNTPLYTNCSARR